MAVVAAEWNEREQPACRCCICLGQECCLELLLLRVQGLTVIGALGVKLSTDSPGFLFEIDTLPIVVIVRDCDISRI